MYDHILIRYGEIALKGKNQKDFIAKLIKNIKEQVFNETGINPYIIKVQGRLFLKLEEGQEPDIFYGPLSRVFGILSFSPARISELDIEKIKEIALDELRQSLTGSKRFRVTAKRPNKHFPMTSPEVQLEVAKHLLNNVPDLEVDLHNADIDLLVEVRTEAAYIYTKKYYGIGGLPVGSSGKGLLLLSGGIDSPVAGWMCMKRGMIVEAIHFHSYPYTSEEAKQKVMDLAQHLTVYGADIVVHNVPFTKIQEQIGAVCHDNMRITIMRRFFLRIAEEIAKKREIFALVTGDNLAQVASQTVESIYAINNVTNMPILRPLVTMEKEEIMQVARRIGTYETSILPYEDCCTVFVPKEPKTKPKVAACEKEEINLDIEALVQEAVEKTELIRLTNRKPRVKKSAQQVN